MPKFLHRIVAVLLVPCLIADPSMASAMSLNSLARVGERAQGKGDVFAHQALMLGLISDERAERIPRVRLVQFFHQIDTSLTKVEDYLPTYWPRLAFVVRRLVSSASVESDEDPSSSFGPFKHLRKSKKQEYLPADLMIKYEERIRKAIMNPNSDDAEIRWIMKGLARLEKQNKRKAETIRIVLLHPRYSRYEHTLPGETISKARFYQLKNDAIVFLAPYIDWYDSDKPVDERLARDMPGLPLNLRNSWKAKDIGWTVKQLEEMIRTNEILRYKGVGFKNLLEIKTSLADALSVPAARPAESGSAAPDLNEQDPGAAPPDAKSIPSLPPVFYEVVPGVGVLLDDFFLENLVLGPAKKDRWIRGHIVGSGMTPDHKIGLMQILSAVHVSLRHGSETIGQESIRDVVLQTHTTPGYITIGRTWLEAGVDVAVAYLAHERRHLSYEMLTADARRGIEALQKYLRVNVPEESREVIDDVYREPARRWEEVVVLTMRDANNELVTHSRQLVAEGLADPSVITTLEKLYQAGYVTEDERQALARLREEIFQEPVVRQDGAPAAFEEMFGSYVPDILRFLNIEADRITSYRSAETVSKVVLRHGIWRRSPRRQISLYTKHATPAKNGDAKFGVEKRITLRASHDGTGPQAMVLDADPAAERPWDRRLAGTSLILSLRPPGIPWQKLGIARNVDMLREFTEAVAYTLGKFHGRGDTHGDLFCWGNERQRGLKALTPEHIFYDASTHEARFIGFSSGQETTSESAQTKEKTDVEQALWNTVQVPGKPQYPEEIHQEILKIFEAAYARGKAEPQPSVLDTQSSAQLAAAGASASAPAAPDLKEQDPGAAPAPKIPRLNISADLPGAVQPAVHHVFKMPDIKDSLVRLGELGLEEIHITGGDKLFFEIGWDETNRLVSVGLPEYCMIRQELSIALSFIENELMQRKVGPEEAPALVNLEVEKLAQRINAMFQRLPHVHPPELDSWVADSILILDRKHIPENFADIALFKYLGLMERVHNVGGGMDLNTSPLNTQKFLYPHWADYRKNPAAFFEQFRVFLQDIPAFKNNPREGPHFDCVFRQEQRGAKIMLPRHACQIIRKMLNKIDKQVLPTPRLIKLMSGPLKPIIPGGDAPIFYELSPYLPEVIKGLRAEHL